MRTVLDQDEENDEEQVIIKHLTGFYPSPKILLILYSCE